MPVLSRPGLIRRMAIAYREGINAALISFLQRRESLDSVMISVGRVAEVFCPPGTYVRVKGVPFTEWRSTLSCASKTAETELRDVFEIACSLSGAFLDIVDFVKFSATYNGSLLTRRVTEFIETICSAEVMFYSLFLGQSVSRSLFELGPDVIRDLVVLLTQSMAVLYHVCFVLSTVLVSSCFKRSHTLTVRKQRRVSNFQLRAHLIVRIVHNRLLLVDRVLAAREGSDFNYEFSQASSFRQFLRETIFITSDYVRSGWVIESDREAEMKPLHVEVTKQVFVREVLVFTVPYIAVASEKQEGHVPEQIERTPPVPVETPEPESKKRRRWFSCFPY